MWVYKVILGILWILLALSYASVHYRQRYLIKWYVPKHLRVSSLVLLSIFFSYTGLEMLCYFLTDHFLFSLFLYSMVQITLILFPIWLRIKLYRLYYEKNMDIPETLKNWHKFGPYLIPHPSYQKFLSILWCNSQKSRFEIGETDASLHTLKSSVIATQKRIKQKIRKLNRVTIDLSKFPRGFYYRLDKSQVTFHISTSLIENLIKPRSKNELNNTIEIVAISDLHADLTSIQKEVNIIRKLCPKPDFIISSGDNITNASTWTSWGRLIAPFEDFLASRPFLSCSGNHDADKIRKVKNWQVILPYHDFSSKKGTSNDLYYSLTFGPLKLFFIDLYNGGHNPRIPNSNQMARLQHDLQNSPEKIKILIMHNSIFCTGEFGCDNVLGEIFLPIIDSFKIPLVISGHAHIFEAFYRKNPKNNLETLFLVNGGGGGKLDDMILKRKSFITVPYRWESREHRAKIQPYLEGNTSSAFRNDKAVLNYQEFGSITHSWCKIKLNTLKIHVEAFDWEGTLLYHKDIPIK